MRVIGGGARLTDRPPFFPPLVSSVGLSIERRSFGGSWRLRGYERVGGARRCTGATFSFFLSFLRKLRSRDSGSFEAVNGLRVWRVDEKKPLGRYLSHLSLLSCAFVYVHRVEYSLRRDYSRRSEEDTSITKLGVRSTAKPSGVAREIVRHE